MDSHSLPIFPTELWLKILGNLSTAEWRMLCLTCHDARNLAQPYLFRTLELDEVSLTGFQRAHPDVAHLVLNLDLCAATTPELWLQDPKPCPSLCEICNFSSLRRLFLQGMHVDVDLCAALRELPHLHKVRYSLCVINTRLATAQPAVWRGPVSHVAILVPLSGTGWTRLLPLTVSSLEIGGLAMVPCETRGRDILMEILHSHGDYRFTTLRLKDEIPHNIVAFLNSCPHVRRLKLSSASVSGGALLADLPATALPKLEDFSGASEYAEIIVPGRPVHTAEIFVNSLMPVGTLSFLRHCGTALTTLVVRYHSTGPPLDLLADDFLGTLSIKPLDLSAESFQYIPRTVRRLHLVQHYVGAAASTWMCTLSHLRMENLRVLELGGGRVPRDVQREFVEARTPAMCTSLQEIVFSPNAYEDNAGSTTWTLSKAGDWVWYSQGGNPSPVDKDMSH